MTIPEGLMGLPPGYSSLALQRHQEAPLVHQDVPKDGQVDGPVNALQYAFLWRRTKEEHVFWESVQAACKRYGDDVTKYPQIPK